MIKRLIYYHCLNTTNTLTIVIMNSTAGAIQSFTISPKTLQEILNSRSILGGYSKVNDLFKNYIKNYSGLDFFYRYVGQSSAASTKKRDGFIHDFTKFLKQTLEGIELLENICRYFYVGQYNPNLSMQTFQEHNYLEEQEILVQAPIFYNPGQEGFNLYQYLPIKRLFF